MLLVIFSFALPFTRIWVQKKQRDILSAQIIQVINYSKTQALLIGEPLRLAPLFADDNWDLGMQLSMGTIQHQVLYEWSWLLNNIHLTWHGFQSKDSLRFDKHTRNQALNGYFLIDSGGKILEKIILNRLGNIRIEMQGK